MPSGRGECRVGLLVGHLAVGTSRAAHGRGRAHETVGRCALWCQTHLRSRVSARVTERLAAGRPCAARRLRLDSALGGVTEISPSRPPQRRAGLSPFQTTLPKPFVASSRLIDRVCPDNPLLKRHIFEQDVDIFWFGTAVSHQGFRKLFCNATFLRLAAPCTQRDSNNWHGKPLLI